MRKEGMQYDWRAPVALAIVILGLLLFGLGYLLDPGDQEKVTAESGARAVADS